jgi:UDP-N-acetylglucosamine 2-epimerase (non-hydrolysing)
MRFLLFAGTRPEIIKLRPVSDALIAQGDEPIWVFVNQSRDLIRDMVLHDACPTPIYVPCDVENYRHQLVGLHHEITKGIIHKVPLDADWKAVVVQGDTQTAASAALTCALAAIPVAHVEAGLRTHKPFPWPEEQNRRMITSLASLHLAPTHAAKTNLRNENVDQGRIVITGQTGIDALHTTLKRANFERASRPRVPRILVTCHRRENKDRISALANALKPLLVDHYVCWPSHPNYGWEVRVAFPFAAPMSHDALVGELLHADLVITDSGGIIEEAAELEKNCLIIRDETERPEAIDHGCWLVKRDEMDRLPHMIQHLLSRSGRARHSKGLYGDGAAAPRVAAALRKILPS